MKSRVFVLLSIIAVMCMALMLAGCGGGSGSNSSATPGVTLRVGADTVSNAGNIQAVSSRATMITSQLDAGATVTAYDFATGSVVATGTIGEDGFCNLQITPGLTVAIVITGQKDGKDFRLSKIVPVVPNVDTTYEATPESTIAAEAIAEKHFRTGTALDAATVEAIEEQAAEFVADHADEDFSVGGGIIAAANFGSTGSLVAEKVTTITAAVPAVINTKLVAAKNAIRQLKEVGYPLSSMVSMEGPDVANVANEVADTYGDLFDRFHDILAPSMIGHLKYAGNRTSVFQLTMGKAYTVSGTSDGLLVITADAAHDVAGQITITRVVDAATLKVVAKKTSSIDWKVTQTSSADSLQVYEVTLPQPEDMNAVSALRVSFSFRDKDYTTALTGNGALIASNKVGNYYTKMNFDGKITTAKLTSQGKFQVNFPTSVPSGAGQYKMVYDFPTSMSISDTSIVMKGEDATITLTGAMTATFQNVDADGVTVLNPKRVDMTGTYSNSHSGLNFSGQIGFNTTSTAIINLDTFQGTVTMKGEISRENYPTYTGEFTCVSAGDTNTVDLSLKSTSGSQWIRAAVTGTVIRQAGPEAATLTITNQAGVVLTFTKAANGTETGSLKVNSETVGDIVRQSGGLKVVFSDDTFEALPYDPTEYVGL